MARKSANNTTKTTTQATVKDGANTTEILPVVATSFEEDKKIKNKANSSDTVIIACSLPHGLMFNDVPTKNGGVKTVVFPGLNDHLKGNKEGIFFNKGNSKAIRIDREDWENIVKMHGQETAFKGKNGNLPCLYKMDTEDEYKSKQANRELETMDNGLNQIKPEEVNVEESDKNLNY